MFTDQATDGTATSQSCLPVESNSRRLKYVPSRKRLLSGAMARLHDRSCCGSASEVPFSLGLNFHPQSVIRRPGALVSGPARRLSAAGSSSSCQAFKENRAGRLPHCSYPNCTVSPFGERRIACSPVWSRKSALMPRCCQRGLPSADRTASRSADPTANSPFKRDLRPKTVLWPCLNSVKPPRPASDQRRIIFKPSLVYLPAAERKRPSCDHATVKRFPLFTSAVSAEKRSSSVSAESTSTRVESS